MDMTDEFWRDDAACRGSDGNVWFPETDLRTASYRSKAGKAAQVICASCPVRKPCLLMAMRAEHGTSLDTRHGIFGGTTPTQRYLLDGGRPGQWYRVPPPRDPTRRVAPTLCQTP